VREQSGIAPILNQASHPFEAAQIDLVNDRRVLLRDSQLTLLPRDWNAIFGVSVQCEPVSKIPGTAKLNFLRILE
jgi:hypothetical protein